jgi:hypothetical protein
MKRIFIGALAVIVYFASSPAAHARAFGLFACGCGHCCNSCDFRIRQYNAFTPVCSGCVTCDGCRPFAAWGGGGFGYGGYGYGGYGACGDYGFGGSGYPGYDFTGCRRGKCHRRRFGGAVVGWGPECVDEGIVEGEVLPAKPGPGMPPGGPTTSAPVEPRQMPVDASSGPQMPTVAPTQLPNGQGAAQPYYPGYPVQPAAYYPAYYPGYGYYGYGYGYGPQMPQYPMPAMNYYNPMGQMPYYWNPMGGR